MTTRADLQRDAHIQDIARALTRLTWLYEYDLLRRMSKDAVAGLSAERHERLNALGKQLWGRSSVV
jgi:hypothetical protein